MLTRIHAMRERAVAESCTFTLLIPNQPRKGGADWTLKTATPPSSASRPATICRLYGTP